MQTAEVRGTDDQARPRLRTIDADAHVVETEHTWDYMDPSDSKYRPVLMAPTTGASKREFWVIEGKVKGLGRTVATAQDLDKLSQAAGRNLSTPREAREIHRPGVDTPRPGTRGEAEAAAREAPC